MEKHPSILFAYPFRIFFFSTAIWSIVVVVLWVGMLSGLWQFPTFLPLLHWHRHEMLFGLVSPAIAGFLLTAVCVWTNTERTHGASLMLLWLVWLLGRILMMAGVGVPENVVIGVNIVFLPLIMIDAGRRVWAAKQARQIPLLGLLFSLWIVEVGMLLYPAANFHQPAMVMMFLLIGIVGGRITPVFTNNWLNQNRRLARARPLNPLWDRVILGGTAILAGCLAVGADAIVPLLALLCGIGHLVRVLVWRFWAVLQEPLLWILHISQLWVSVSLCLLAGSANGWWQQSLWLHAGAIGAISSLILGIMARVSLGHTGRSLVLPFGVTLAFFLIQFSTGLRLALGFSLLEWNSGIILTTITWVAAFSIFLWRYTGILMSPRLDGKPG